MKNILLAQESSIATVYQSVPALGQVWRGGGGGCPYLTYKLRITSWFLGQEECTINLPPVDS